jgi:prepilin-type N-terminal cleavage/methylation domain-containing protein
MNIAPSVIAKRGFTLIELLVVIAIIGILSSVVLASLNTARAKGTDAKIQSEIRSIAVNAEIYYDNNSNSYGSTVSNDCAAGIFASTNPNIAQIIGDLELATSASDPVCYASSTAWAVYHAMTSNTNGFCMDSTGKVSTSSTAITAAACN